MLANLLTGLNIKERDNVIPLINIANMEKQIDSDKVLTYEEKQELIESSDGYITSPNIIAYLLHSINKMAKSKTLEEQMVVELKLVNVLTRAAKLKFDEKVKKLNYQNINSVYKDLLTIDEALIYNHIENINDNIEAVNLFKKMNKDFNEKASILGLSCPTIIKTTEERYDYYKKQERKDLLKAEKTNVFIKERTMWF